MPEKEHVGHGGRRKGAGRKPVGARGQISVYLHDTERRAIAALLRPLVGRGHTDNKTISKGLRALATGDYRIEKK